jgi:hypothetical protein
MPHARFEKANIEWVNLDESDESLKRADSIFSERGCIIAFTRPYFITKELCVFEIEHSSGWLSGGKDMYVLARKNDRWTVLGTIPLAVF